MMYILKIKPEILKKLENEAYGCITEIIVDGEDETSARKNAQKRTWGNEIDQQLDNVEQKKIRYLDEYGNYYKYEIWTDPKLVDCLPIKNFEELKIHLNSDMLYKQNKKSINDNHFYVKKD